ncbi:MAG TPA: sn-glycerol-3-phosphate ABC transporter ATP-binding protein UgpC [Bacteroidota bacterium]|nr:sn-glycerol-3-phosphate ABC transporter ATP-binding protein UgpC [Bacteroidota bacterium]
MADVRFDHVRKVYGKQAATIPDLSLHIRDGEFMVLVGPSGCGKSTTLRMIAGLEEATDGHIFIGERRVNDVAPRDRDIAMVFQNYALYPHMNVRENMAFGLKLRKLPAAEIDARVGEAAELLEIGALLDRKPKELSGGQRQRVALGRAIVRKPTVFLFDEPLSNLDAKLRVQMRTEIKKLHARLGTTMVYVTHDQVEAMTMGDRITVMKDGIIHQVDTPMALYDTPADTFVAGFIGTPAMNMLPATLRGAELHVPGTDACLPLPTEVRDRLHATDEGAYTLGLRPEHLMASPQSTNGAVLHTRHDISEMLGHEMYLHCTVGPHRITARSAGSSAPAIGDIVSFQVDMQRAIIFETHSGRALYGT